MKKMIIMFIFLLLSCKSEHINTVSSSPNILADKVIKSLQANNLNEFMEFVVKLDEMYEMIYSSNDSKKIKITKDQIYEDWLQNTTKISNQFKQIIDETKINDIDLQNSVIINVEYSIEDHNGLMIADYIDIHLKYNNNSYIIRLDDCVKNKRGWLIVDSINWKRNN